MMTKTPFKVLAVGAALALAASSAFGQQPQRAKWKMQSAFGSTLPHLGTSGVRFAQNVTDATDGRFDIKFFEPGALVPALECFDPASKGSVEACWTTPGYHTGKLGPGISFFTTVPFGPHFGEFMAWKRHGGGDKLRDEIYAAHGLIAIDSFAIGPETSGWFKMEVKSLDQLKGVRACRARACPLALARESHAEGAGVAGRQLDRDDEIAVPAPCRTQREAEPDQRQRRAREPGQAPDHGQGRRRCRRL